MPPRPKRMQPMEAGYEGAVLIDASVRLTATRYEDRILRCQPGTFEWRYGRKNADTSLYHAGISFSGKWERASIHGMSAMNMERGFGGNGSGGLTDSRAIAFDEIDAIRMEIGARNTSMLVDYCVMGTPSAKIADKYGKSEREMTFILHEALTACAVALRMK
jgi:hypothetical protein